MNKHGHNALEIDKRTQLNAHLSASKSLSG